MDTARQRWILESGAGYLVDLTHGSPFLTTDPMEGTRYDAERIEIMSTALEALGYVARTIPVSIGRYPR